MGRMRRVVVTGMGVVSPVGFGVETFWDAISRGASGISRIEMFLDNASIKVCSQATSCQTKYSTASLAKGSHTITVTATDQAPSPNTGSASIMVIK